MPVNRGYTYRHIIQQPLPAESVCQYLARRFPHSAEADWREAIAAGEVLLGSALPSPEQSVRAGEELVWTRAGWSEEPVPLTYEVLHSDPQVLVVNKPSGLPTLPGAGFLEHTLWHQVRGQFPEARPLHRLGRATSGLVLFALTAEAARLLSRAWNSIEKEYWAVAQGVAEVDLYEIAVPIGPVPHHRLGTIHAVSPPGKPARSLARVLARELQLQQTLFSVQLGTGRPHQIRIHLAAIGHPLVGDPIYVAGGLPRQIEPGLPGDGGYRLHARQLKLAHPISGETLQLSASPPPGFLAGFEQGEWAGHV